MKRIILILILMSFSCKSKKTLHETNVPKFELGVDINAKISKIDSIENYYLVYIENDNNHFKIVSDKKQAKPYNGLKIETGKNYKLRIRELTSYAPKTQDQRNRIANYLDIKRCVYFKSTEICTEPTFELSTSSNLKGLYLTN